VRDRFRTAAPDEVDDFEVIAVFQDGLSPTVARGDFAIEFNGDAVGLHIERFDQRRERELGGRRRVLEGAGFSVYVQFHQLDFLTGGGYAYSDLRNTNFRVTVRPSWLA
jgi:hypothetical protein